LRRRTTEACLKQEGKIPSRKERLASSAMSSEKRLRQALIMEVGIQSAGEALAGQDARILWISVTRTGGMFPKRGPKWGGSEKTGGFGMAESLAVIEDLRSLILDTK